MPSRRCTAGTTAHDECRPASGREPKPSGSWPPDATHGSSDTGNGFYGGFLLSTWRAVGGRGYPHQNSAGEQAYRAEILRQRAGLGQWPVCGRYYR